MKSKTFINEVFFIRAIATLSVVLVHSITVTVNSYQLPALTVDIFRGIQMTLMFATPTFILISEILAAYSYPEKTPKGFLWKRFKFIFVPYMVIGTIYALYHFTTVPFSMDAFLEEWISIVLKGQWHGYFVLIIFQFYILHFLFARYLSKVSGTIILPITFVINGVYLGYFNFVDPVGATQFYIWYDVSRIPFLAWIFYFSLAYYVGKNLTTFKYYLNRFKWIILVGAVGLAGFVVYSYHTGFINMIWSNRVDVMVYTVFMMFALFYLGSRFKKIPKFITLISKFSFGIYLLHPLFHKIFVRTSHELPYINMGIYLLIALLLGVFGSMLVTFLLNKIRFGKYVVGKTGVTPKKEAA
ncbi:acyltransferase family protein [Ornithinibacillus scapharcae]|uniref:acyltransferase family protein n=1 Tax=Ornithinibacillus scapharcae TaxID=1147159 RepID=UPI000225B81B|nr:acyltransferase family protein [Ornithinibacillus scapharcae]